MPDQKEALSKALRALCLIQDYIREEALPPIEGWEWFEAGKMIADLIPDDEWAEQFRIRISTVPKAMEDLKKAIQSDPDYAWGWHCKIAMSAHDEGLPRPEANKAAARFMKDCFDIDMTKHEHFADTQTPLLEIKEGMIVQVNGDWFYNMYNYGNEAMHSCIGLGKQEEFPILRSEITDAKEIVSAVTQFHKKDIILWWNYDSGFYSFTAPVKDGNGEVIENVYYEKVIILNRPRKSVKYFEERFIACTYQLNEKMLISKHKSLEEITYDFISDLSVERETLGARVIFKDMGLTVDEREIFFEDPFYYKMPT